MQFFEYQLDAISADAHSSETGRACWGEEKGHLWLASFLRSHTQTFVKCKSIDSAIPQSHAATRFDLCAIRISNFLRFDVLPARKLYKDEPWASTAFRYLFQTSLAVYLGRLGDENAINHVADLIDTGHARVRQACLVLLSTRIFEDGDPLPTPWVDCLRRLSDDPSVNLRLLSLITRLHSIEELVPKLLEVRNRLDLDEQLHVTLNSIFALADSRRQEELLDEAAPLLDVNASRKWFGEFAASAITTKRTRDRDLAASVLERLMSQSDRTGIARFLTTREARNHFLSYVKVEHLPVMRSIAEDSSIAMKWRREGVKMFAQLNPERELDEIFECCDADFDLFAESIGDPRDEAETESAIRLGKIALEEIRSSLFSRDADSDALLGVASVGLLWSCGDSGRELLLESMENLDLAAIQSLTWLSEGTTIATAVSWTRELELATTSPVALRLSLEKKGDPLGPPVVFHLMGLCKRFVGRKSIYSATPPTKYAERLEQLASSTAGQLDSMSVSVSSHSESVTGRNISLKWKEIESTFQVSDGGDSPDFNALKIMNQFADTCGLDARFREVDDGAFWGPPESIEQLIENACIAVSQRPSDLVACRETCIARIERARETRAVQGAFDSTAEASPHESERSTQMLL